MFNTVPLLTAATTLFASAAALHQSTGTLGAALNTVVVGEAPLANVVAAGAAVELDGELTRPHVLDTQVADVVVRVRGASVCSGIPVTRTKFVVTAAHCVLDAEGDVVGSSRVLRDGVEFAPVSLLVNRDYHDSPSPLLDAAVLVMPRTIPGRSAALGEGFPTEGLLTVAGFQPLDTDGSLLRGTRYDNRPLPQGAIGGVVKIEMAVAGCVELTSEAATASDQVQVPCGLIPGASGGGAFVESNGEVTVVGIISTVALDLSSNGLVPLSALHELFENPAAYTYDMTRQASTRRPVANVFRA